ncbi:MAG TPA: NUDIX hydrolase [Thermoanaerobaculia bacterium]|nr:NUDIX hydrolase [Thermoanaerobaculia bacterium]
MGSIGVRDDQLPAGAGTAGEVVPLPAASVILLRDEPLEVLMIRRHERSSFVPNAWVFPGGTLDHQDRVSGGGEELTVMRITALRELFEETGIWLGAPLEDAEAKRKDLLTGTCAVGPLLEASPVDLERLVLTSRWITPVGVPKRFDTWFFLATTGRDAVATAENTEAVETTWIAPAEALARHEAGDFPMVFPTLRNLEAIAPVASAAALVESRRGCEVHPLLPLLVIEEGKKKIVLPEP